MAPLACECIDQSQILAGFRIGTTTPSCRLENAHRSLYVASQTDRKAVIGGCHLVAIICQRRQRSIAFPLRNLGQREIERGAVVVGHQPQRVGKARFSGRKTTCTQIGLTKQQPV